MSSRADDRVANHGLTWYLLYRDLLDISSDSARAGPKRVGCTEPCPCVRPNERPGSAGRSIGHALSRGNSGIPSASPLVRGFHTR
jgi:hypothetical protein